MSLMILLKPHVWEKSDTRVNAKMLSANQIARFLNFNTSKTIRGIKLILLHAGTYLLKLQIGDAILGDAILWSGIPRYAERSY